MVRHICIRCIKITLVCVDVIYSHFRISVNCLNHFYWVSLAQTEIGLKYGIVIPSSLTLAGFAKFSAPTNFDTEYNLQPLVEPCCLRVEQALLQWHGSDSYTSKGYKNEIRKAKYPIDSRNYRWLVFILRLPRYSLTFGFPGHVRRYILKYINEITVLLIFNSYSSRTRRIWADIYNQRGRRPSWLLSAHIRQVREE